MKFIHLSDLHIGKRLNEYSLLEDQEYILNQIIEIIKNKQVEAVVLAGDIYDKNIPSAEAVSLFNWFLSTLAKENLKIFIISGNHDSAQRLSFGEKIMDNSGIYIAPVFSRDIKTITLSDEFGDVNFYLLPFIKPVNVKMFYSDENIVTYEEAVKTVVDNIEVDENKRNVIVTHQFITGALRCDSEEISVGGTDNIDYKVFDKFDYVALGHIHSAQFIGRETVRYCGTPLKYSFSETGHIKSATIVELGQKGDVLIETLQLNPKRDLTEIRGNFDDLTSKNFYDQQNRNDYFRIILTDEEEIIDVASKLRLVYPNLMKIEYDNQRTRSNSKIDVDEKVEEKQPIELFSDFFEMQNNSKMNQEQIEYMTKLFENQLEEK